MSVNSIRTLMGTAYGAYNKKLTQETRAELMKLGIPFDSNITENEGKRLLNIYKSNNSANKQNLQNNNQQNGLFEKAKKLAQKVGVEVEEKESFENLLSKIESAITNRLESSKNDETELKKLQLLSQELANIQAESNGSSGYDNTNKALMTSLEMLGEYNKNFLLK